MKQPGKAPQWNPLKDFENLQSAMRSLSAMTGNGGPGLLPGGNELADWRPAVDVSEDDGEYIITADLPNVSKDDIKVSEKDGVLMISGETKREKEDRKKTWHRVERSYGKYMRSFQLPAEVDHKNIDAVFKDGVLKIHLPKAAGKRKKSKGTRIPVN